ncbi:MAG: bifunctional diaminohydroxyphosphoribosylaminopyrimidine deaminase/5-amino-6-(5-phosphoribosylamino)uracil reductase RibD [Pseudomonadota bacterium]
MQNSASEDDRRWMAAALALARRAVGRVAPNPAVAALLVRDGVLLARGITARGGRPHAEAVALADAARRGVPVAGATAYVTLEPCAHHGLTPPCADALATAGIARVVCPIEDPDPRVSGRGFGALRRMGVEVVTGVCAEEAESVNAGFLSRIRRSRPFVTLKLATTLDGRIATATGESRWITGPAARRRVHLMRLHSDAVLVGAGTARADDPMLDVRGFGQDVAQPLRAVADPRLTLAPMSRLARTAHAQPVLVAHLDTLAEEDPQSVDRTAALEDAGVQLLPCPPASMPRASGGAQLDMEPGANRAPRPHLMSTVATGSAMDGPPHAQPASIREGDPGAGASGASDAIDLRVLLEGMAERGAGSVLVEGGGTLAAALIEGGLVDRLIVFAAGAVIGADGRAGVGALGLERLAAAPRFRRTEVSIEGADIMSVWEPVPPSA